MRKKVTVFGGGNVGATAALYISEMGVADVTVVDIVEGMPQGKSLDLMQSRSVRGFDSTVTGSNDFQDVRGSDIVVLTAGFPRKPGMSRTDLLRANADIVKTAAEAIREHAPNAFVVVVTNPLDVMTYEAWHVTGFPRERVLGMAGVLDATRFRCFIAMELGVSPNDVQAMVLGGHGDSMVPLPRYATVSGIALPDLLPKETIDRLVKRTRDGGAEIVALLKTGSAYYAPAASVASMVKAILLDEKRLLPAAVHLNGQYGMKDLFIGVPIILGEAGVEKIVELKLAPDELAALQASGKAVLEGIRELHP